jgi:hypothetical protein
MIQKKLIRFVYTLVLLIVLIACSPQISTNTSTSPTEMFPTPETDKAVFAGRVVDMSGTPIGNIELRLAEVYRSDDGESDGAYILDTAFSPGTISDENGYFVFSDIEPMEYVLVLGNPENVYEIITDESGKAKVWEPEANQVLDIGELRTDFDPTEY